MVNITWSESRRFGPGPGPCHPFFFFTVFMFHPLLDVRERSGMRAEVDAGIADQPDKPRSYPDAIRRLMRPTLDWWLKNKSK